MIIVHFVIMGCGRVGASLAVSLERHGHSVAIIDQNPDSFRRLPEEFDGRKIAGIGFDRETLVEAGIKDAYGFAAVSNGDNSNILAARVVRETFGITNVVARIYDPRRAEIYQKLGITTVATVRWTSDQVIRRLLPQGATSEYRDASGAIILVEADVDPAWIGSRLTAIEEISKARIAYVSRFGEGTLPTPDMVLQEGDILHLLLPIDSLAEVERVLTTPPPKEEA